jgi:hypothetical protein
MKKADVHLGATYLVKVAGNLVPVKIDREHASGGWEGTSVKTGKTIRIKSPQRLRKRLEHATADKAAKQVRQDIAETVEAMRNGNLAEGIKVPISGRENSDSKPMSLLNAAAEVLAIGDAMRCKDIVDVAVAKGLWSPGTGKTPANTLYAAILREINTKGDTSRFVKIERGKFELAK